MPSRSAIRGKAVRKNLSYSSMTIFCWASALSMPFGPVADAGVELLERGGFLFQRLLVQDVEHLLHRLADGVVLREGVVGEQRVEHRPGDQVLREHLDRIVARDGGVEVRAASPRGTRRRPWRASDFGSSRRALMRVMCVSAIVGDVARPSLPVGAVAAPS